MDQTWQHSPEVGFDSIDVDHRTISLETERMLDAVNGGRDAEIGVQIAALVSHITRHFAAEERLMRNSAYPKMAGHCEAHASFLRDANAFKTHFDEKGLTLAFRRWATGRLLKWFRFHIVAYDVELGQYLRTTPSPLPPAVRPGIVATQ